MSLRTGASVPRPAPEQDCPANFGNSTTAAPAPRTGPGNARGGARRRPRTSPASEPGSGSLRMHCRGVDVELVEGAVGIGAGAVGVVGPGRPRFTTVEGKPGVVTVVDPIARVVRVRGPCADLDVGAKRRAVVSAERAPELGIVVGDPVGVPGAASAEVTPGVVPDGGDVA